MTFGFKIVLTWLIILVFAILNGTLREKYLFLYFEQDTAFLISGILLCVIVFIVSYSCIKWLGVLRRHHCFLVGLFWLILTLVFEFAFGMLLLNKNFAQMLEAYLLKDGNIWSIVLLFVFLSPCVSRKLKKALNSN